MSGQSQRFLSINHYCCELMLSCSRTRPSGNQTQYLSIRRPVLYHKAIVLHKILVNNQETGMFMKDFLRYIRLSSVSDLYTLEKKKDYFSIQVSQARKCFQTRM